MFAKIYMGIGVALCVGLGIAYVMEWKAPDLSGSGGRPGGGGGRGIFFFFTGGGGGFGK